MVTMDATKRFRVMRIDTTVALPLVNVKDAPPPPSAPTWQVLCSSDSKDEATKFMEHFDAGSPDCIEFKIVDSQV